MDSSGLVPLAPDERRRAARYELERWADIIPLDAEGRATALWAACIKDLSSTGARLTMVERLARGARIVMAFRPEPHAEPIIRHGVVRWDRSLLFWRQMGVEFCAPLPGWEGVTWWGCLERLPTLRRAA